MRSGVGPPVVLILASCLTCQVPSYMVLRMEGPSWYLMRWVGYRDAKEKVVGKAALCGSLAGEMIALRHRDDAEDNHLRSHT